MRYPVMLFPEGDPSKAYAIATEPGEEAALRNAGYRTLREMKAANDEPAPAEEPEIPAPPRKRGRPRKE